MNGELAAIAALAARGSRWLSMGGAGPAPELLNTNSCSQCVGVLNVNLGRSPILGRRKRVRGTAAWLTELHRLGVDRLFLVTELVTVGDLPRRLASAFANSGGWGVLAQSEQPAIWTLQWTVGDRNAPNSKNWELNATSASATGVQPTVPDVEAARSNLRSTVQDWFAERSGLGNWSPWFARAQALLDDADPTPPSRATSGGLRAHPQWRNFGGEEGRYPPMRGWLAVPLIGSDGENYGFIQAFDRLEGGFAEQDEANLLHLASLTATALDALAQLHLPEYRAKVADLGQ